MTSEVIEGHKSSSNFSINPTLSQLDSPMMLPPLNCVDLSLSPSLSKISPLIALNANLWTFLSMLLIEKGKLECIDGWTDRLMAK